VSSVILLKSKKSCYWTSHHGEQQGFRSQRQHGATAAAAAPVPVGVATAGMLGDTQVQTATTVTC